jgi:probable rRNA maturation factor
LQIILDVAIKVNLGPTHQKRVLKWVKLANETMSEYVQKTRPSIFPKNITHLEFGLVLCGEKRIQQLNTQFRQKAKVTDVLSFPMFSNLRMHRDDLSIFNSGLHLGDLVICHQKVIEQSGDFKISYEEELIHLIFHGFLHLLGYDHELSKAEEKKMELLEKKLINMAKKKRRN